LDCRRNCRALARPAEPIARFHRTFNVVFALVFGRVDQAFAAARSLHRRHSQVTGFLPQAAGPFKAGSHYRANDISALRWLHVTLAESGLVAHDLVYGSLNAEDRARHYSESQLFAGMLGIPRSALPGDYRGLEAYTQGNVQFGRGGQHHGEKARRPDL
jgi:uncharacterized protein (DUF2236 family)